MAELEEVGVLLQEGFHEPGLGKPGEVRHGLGLPGAHEVGELRLGALQGPLGLVQVLPGLLGPVLGPRRSRLVAPPPFTRTSVALRESSATSRAFSRTRTWSLASTTWV